LKKRHFIHPEKLFAQDNAAARPTASRATRRLPQPHLGSHYHTSQPETCSLPSCQTSHPISAPHQFPPPWALGGRLLLAPQSLFLRQRWPTPKHSFQSKAAARIYINRIVTFSFPMEGSSFLPAPAKESLSFTGPYIILKDGPLQKLGFPSISFQLSAVPACSRGTMIYHSPESAERVSSLEVPAENAALQLLRCCQRLLPRGTQD